MGWYGAASCFWMMVPISRVPFLFSWLMKYLEAEGVIQPEPAKSNIEWLQLGKTVFRPFESYDGSYVQADAHGYQFLLNLDRRDQAFPYFVIASSFRGKGEI